MARLGISLGTFGALMTFSCGHMLEHVAFECPGIPTLLTTLCTLIFGIFNMFAPEMSLQLWVLEHFFPQTVQMVCPDLTLARISRSCFFLYSRQGSTPRALSASTWAWWAASILSTTFLLALSCSGLAGTGAGAALVEGSLDCP